MIMTVGTTFPTKAPLIYLEEGLVSPHPTMIISYDYNSGSSTEMVLAIPNTYLLSML